MAETMAAMTEKPCREGVLACEHIKLRTMGKCEGVSEAGQCIHTGIDNASVASSVGEHSSERV